MNFYLNVIIVIIIFIINIIIININWAGNVARMEEGRNAFKILIGKHTEKRPLGRPRRRWEDN